MEEQQTITLPLNRKLFIETPSSSQYLANYFVEKIIARTFSAIQISSIFSQSLPFAQTFSFQAISEVVAKSRTLYHDIETEINLEANDYEEPKRPDLDVFGPFNLRVQKQTIISKGMPADQVGGLGQSGSLNMARTFKGGPSSVLSLTRKLEQRYLKHLLDKGEEIKPKPLLSGREPEDEEVAYHRRKKEKEQKIKEEEILKQQALMRQLNDLDDKNSKGEEDRAKDIQQYTYDNKGEVIFIKSPMADRLPNPLLNPKFRVKDASKNGQVSNLLNNSTSDFNLLQKGKLNQTQASKGKIQLITQLVTSSQIKDQIIPMGSIFKVTEPNHGVTIIEKGSMKQGQANKSKQKFGQMSREEYNVHKEQSIIKVENIVKDKRQKHSSSQPNLFTDSVQSSILQNEISKHQVSKFNPPAPNTQVMDSLYLTMNNSKESDFSNFYNLQQSQSALNSIRSRDRMTSKKQDSIHELITERKSFRQGFMNDNFLDQNTSSYVPSIKFNSRELSSLDRKSSQQFNKSTYNSQLSLTMKYGSNLNQVRLNPLAISRGQSPLDHYTDRTNLQYQQLQNKNRQIMNDHSWGNNPTGIGTTNSSLKKIERRPPIQTIEKDEEFRKTTNHLIINKNKKARHFIQQIKERTHLPPPPIGKTIGHGYNNQSKVALIGVSQFNQSSSDKL